MTKPPAWCLCLFLLVQGIVRLSAAQQSPLPEGGSGLAAKYPGDAGIAKDDSVVFVENFEQRSLDSMWKRWDVADNRGDMTFSRDVPPGSGGRQSLIMERREGSGGHLYRRLENERGGYGHELLFARFYVKFAAGCGELHHFGTNLGGYNPPTPWAQGGAGRLPDGGERFTVGLEPNGGDWGWDFYSYWQGMHVHGDGRYWGTPFLTGGEKPKIEFDRWICVEMMVKMNSPVDAANGEMAFWVDGKLFSRDGQIVSHIGPGFPKGRWTGGWWRPDPQSPDAFEGFAWRNTEELAINYLWVYTYSSKPAGHWTKVWFDDIVVAKEYIGPLTSKKSSSGPFWRVNQ